MDNLDQLLIRACKSKEPEIRLRSVYRRFYLSTDDEIRVRVSLVAILARICDDNLTSTITEVITGLSPNRYNILNTKTEYLDRTLSFLISKIRLAKTDDLQGLTPPAKFRRKR